MRQNFGCIYCWYSSLPYFEGQIFLIGNPLLFDSIKVHLLGQSSIKILINIIYIFVFFLPNGRFLCNM